MPASVTVISSASRAARTASKATVRQLEEAEFGDLTDRMVAIAEKIAAPLADIKAKICVCSPMLIYIVIRKEPNRTTPIKGFKSLKKAMKLRDEYNDNKDRLGFNYSYYTVSI